MAGTITVNGSNGLGANQAGGNGAAVSLNATGTISVQAITANGGNGVATNAAGGNAGSITVATNSGDITTNGAALKARTGTGLGTGAVTLAGGSPTNALTTLTTTGASNTLGSIQTKGAQTYTGATNLNGALATLGTAGADIVTFNSPVTLTGNSSLTTAGGVGDNISIAQTVNGNFNLALNAGTSGNVSTGAVIGGATALNNFSATGAAVTLGRSITANSIFARSTAGNITLNNAGTVLAATGTGNAIELVAGGASSRFVNNAGAGAINASNGAGRFLVWSQNPANDTRGGLSYAFKRYAATFGSSAVADTNTNDDGFLYTIAPAVTATLGGSASKTYDGTTTAPVGSLTLKQSGAIDGDTVSFSALSSATYDNKM